MSDEPLQTESPEQPPSKSQRKREAGALQALGERLVALPAATLAGMPLDGELREAVALARRIKARGGRRRQLQYIGKLMRQRDTTAIQAALADLDRGRQAEARRQRELEALRDRLIEMGDAALGEVIERHPDVDRQQLRQLIRQARRDQAAGKAAGPRALFRHLRALEED
ncbi:ribosome biogenesis factor YjgA [Thiohalobacter sp.]|uniref:ribosome biogenesis factor YjgA n=1 Tax=Thiohalobacter sp. TaxID=2025948 RepID=UPI002608EB84|nr:ribosome biogenesis factor YjgA [Thiohalobacter sp.]